MSAPFFIGSRTNTEASCHCCGTRKPRDGVRTCAQCQAAGCKFDCGWKRGGRGRGNTNNGKPFCPVIARAKRNSQYRSHQR